MKKIVLLLGIFLALESLSFAEDDWQYWSVYTVKYKLNDHWSMLWNPEFRLRDDMGELSFWRSRQGVSYSFNSYVQVGANYLYAEKQSAAGRWSDEHTFENDVVLKSKFGGWKFSDRIRLEHRDIEVETKYRYRNQLKVARPGKIGDMEFTPYVSHEMFYDEEANLLNQHRASVGIVKKLTDHLSVDVSWMYKSDRSGDDWMGTNVLRTNMVLTF